MTNDRTTAGAKGIPRALGGDSLPRYARPPVVEVAISVAFDELASFQFVHFGLFWERIRDRYPMTDQHPRLPITIELFDVKGPQRASLHFAPPVPIGRCWYLTEDNSRLIQVQPDRFIINWRKLEAESKYPSYDELRGTFVKELEEFLSFVTEYQLGSFGPTQCELTYVNHIPAGDGWNKHDEVQNVLALWSGVTSESSLPDVEGVDLSWHYRLDDPGMSPGRLHVRLQSAFRSNDRQPVFLLQLDGRGAPTTSDLQGVLSSLDKSHDWIVRGFTAVTTGRMHTLWERTR